MKRYLSILTVAALLAACSVDGPGITASTVTMVTTVTTAAPATTARPTTTAQPATTAVVTSAVTTTVAAPARLDVTLAPGSGQLAILDAEPGTPFDVLSGDAVAASGVADAQGSLLARRLPPGEYTVRSGDAVSEPVVVAGVDVVPPSSLYLDQELPAPGFGYVETRDGTTLSANIVLPGPIVDGPYPTVVEYSGYAPSNPGAATSAQLYTALGFAYVGVNMRGTGCSGGSYQFFEPAQSLDGYDVIETVAAQPWVLHGEVGMVGVSYPGISQLFVASTRPPHLAAITPLSVLDDSYRSTLYPGGMLNTGFAVEWARQRMQEAAPYGQAWTKEQADAGDDTCAANQRLRLQNPDLLQLVRDNPFYDPAMGDEINPSTLVGSIDVPVFIAGAWQDEQTGGRFPALIERFTSSPHVFATLVNGLHTESLSLGVFQRYAEFLDLYVARRTPELSAAARVIPGILYQSLTGVGGLELPADRFTGMAYEDALAAFEAEPAVRVLFEEGAADGTAPGAPAPRFTAEFPAWPIPSAVPTPIVLTSGPGGTAYTYDPDAVPDTFFAGSGSGIWQADVTWDWRPAPVGAVVAFEGPALSADQVLIGPASADLWITSTAPDTDLEVTITEVRPDGNEVYVQSGWLRASHRALDEAASTPLRPVQTHLAGDATPLTAGEPTLVRVEIFPFAHVFRAGSRIRIIVGSPGNNRGQWAFENLPAGGDVEILTDAAHPSQVVVPVVPGVAVPAGAPACGSLRGQPCRPYVAFG